MRRCCLLHEFDIPFEDWDLGTLIERFPAFDGAMFGPPKRPDDDEFWADPSSVCSEGLDTRRRLHLGPSACSPQSSAGVREHRRVAFRTEVAGIGRVDGRVTGVTLSSGDEINAPVVVNVAVSQLIINRMAGLDGTMNITTKALRHELHRSHPRGGPTDRPAVMCRMATPVSTSGRIGRQHPHRLGRPGLRPQGVDRGPDDYDVEVSQEQWEVQVLRLARRMPTSVSDVKSGVVGLFDVADDWIPIYDKTDLGGFYVAIGTSGNQYKQVAAAAWLSSSTPSRAVRTTTPIRSFASVATPDSRSTCRASVATAPSTPTAASQSTASASEGGEA